MKLVIDANILFSLAKPSISTNAIVSTFPLKLISPEFALVELRKYKKEISKKSKMHKREPISEFLKSYKERLINLYDNIDIDMLELIIDTMVKTF